MHAYPKLLAFTIASGAKNSDILSYKGGRPLAIKFPSAMTGAALAVSVGTDDSVAPLINPATGAAMSNAKVNSAWVPLPKAKFEGFSHLRLASGSNEAAARTIYVLFER